MAVFTCATVGTALPTVTITSTFKRTNSAAISAHRSVRPSDQRYSIAMLRFSIQPNSRRCATKAAVHGLKAEASCAQEAYRRQFSRLLRARRERPRRRRAAEQRDEVAARLRLDTGLSLPPAIPTLVWKVPANHGTVRSVYLGASLPRNAWQVLETDLDRLYPRRRASRSDDDIQRWRCALCGLLFDLEAELIDQCAPLAFLALDVGGVLLRRAGHRPTAVGDQAHFHVVGVDDLAQLPVEALDNRWRRAGRREQSVIEHHVEPG